MSERAKGRLGRLLLVLTVLLVAAIAVYAMRGWRKVPIPQPDVSQAHPLVASYIRQLREQIELHPDAEEAWGLYGRALMAHHWYDEADACFHRAAELNDREMRWPYYRAVIAERRDLEQAAELYAQAAALAPQHAPLHQRWGEVLTRLDRLSDAVERFRHAAELAPDEPYPHVGLGRAAVIRGDFEEAEQHFSEAVRIAPDSLAAQGELARVRFRLGKTQPGPIPNRIEEGAPGESAGMPDPVLAEISEQERIALGSADEADALVAQGQLDAAAAAYQELVTNRPDLARPRLNLATIQMARGDMPRAIEMYRRVVEQFPDDALAHYALGSALERAGQLVEAMRAYKESVRLKPDYAQAHFARGLLFEQNRQFEEAVDSYRQAVESDPRLAPAQLALGVALQRHGDLQGAITHIQNAVALAPGDPVPLQYLKKAEEALAERTAPANSDMPP